MTNLRASFRNFVFSLAYYNRYPQRLYADTCVKLDVWRDIPEFFQKTCQAAVAVLMINRGSPLPSSPSLIARVFSTGNLIGSYNLFKLPYRILFPITLDRIDENELLKSTAQLISEQFKEKRKEDIKQIAKDVLLKQFEVMNRHGDAYQSVDDFKKMLERRFRALKPITVQEDEVLVENGLEVGKAIVYDFSKVNLKDLKVPITKISSTALLEAFNWTLADIGGLALFIQGWKLLPSHLPFEGWMRGIVTSAYLLKMTEAARLFRHDAITSQQQRKAKWDIIGSFFEIIPNGYAFLNCIVGGQMNNNTLMGLAIFAKSIGIAEIMTRPKRIFFEPRVPTNLIT